MPNVPDRQVFENAYNGEAPWDIGRAQKSIVAVADRIRGSVLDSGCGTGDASLFLAERGANVTGIDFLPAPIERAKKKAAERKLNATFLVKDALQLTQWNQRFDNAIDCGLFHVFTDDDRQHYVAGLAHVLKPGGHLFLICFSDAEPGEVGPRRIPKSSLQEAFKDGWTVESIEPTVFETNPKLKELPFSPGGPKAWFAIVQRK